MAAEASDLRPILNAYKEVVGASWPNLHPDIVANSEQWPGATAAQLQAALDRYLREATLAPFHVRVFWKLGPDFRFGGCNHLFAADAGLPAQDLIGTDDYDKRLPWFAQAAKYRTDDEEVFRSGRAKLDILERQRSSAGIIWVRASKAPIRNDPGRVVGILGVYEVLNSDMGRRLFTEQTQGPPPV
jgi:hypothetical protein